MPLLKIRLYRLDFERYADRLKQTMEEKYPHYQFTCRLWPLGSTWPLNVEVQGPRYSPYHAIGTYPGALVVHHYEKAEFANHWLREADLERRRQRRALKMNSAVNGADCEHS